MVYRSSSVIADLAKAEQMMRLSVANPTAEPRRSVERRSDRRIVESWDPFLLSSLPWRQELLLRCAKRDWRARHEQRANNVRVTRKAIWRATCRQASVPAGPCRECATNPRYAKT